MTNRAFTEALRQVAPLEGTHEPPFAPRVRARGERPRQNFDVVHLERETTDWIAGERIEAG